MSLGNFFWGGKNLKLGKDIWISLYLTTTDSTMERQKFCPLKYEHKEICAQELLGGVHKLRLQSLSLIHHLPPSVYIFYGIKVYI